MRELISKTIRHPLISGSAIIFVSSFIGNILNYIFNLGLGRFLSVADYGILSALISTIGIFYVFSTAITTVFTKFSASYVAQENRDLIAPLLKKGSTIIAVFSLIVSGTVLLFSNSMAQFLRIDNKALVYIIALIIIVTFLSAVVNGILQGLMKFIHFSILTIFSAFIKLALGFVLIFLGLRVFGAMTAIVISLLFGYFMVLIFLSKYIKTNKNNLSITNLEHRLFTYALPVFLAGLGITMFTSIDVILVKHFFDPTTAGQYGALSLMGRSIFYIVYPIMFVSFPLIAQKKERKENLGGTLLLSVVLIGLASVFLSFIYFVFPEVVLKIFFPAKIYSSLTSYLGPFSIFILFFSLASMLNNFYLSIGKTKVYIFTLIGSIFETLFIILFHQNITEIVTSLISISFLLLISLLLYYPYATKEN